MNKENFSKMRAKKKKKMRAMYSNFFVLEAVGVVARTRTQKTDFIAV